MVEWQQIRMKHQNYSRHNMRKLQGIILSVLIIVAVTGCAKTDTKSSKKNRLHDFVSAVEDAMSQKRSDDTTNDTQKNERA